MKSRKMKAAYFSTLGPHAYATDEQKDDSNYR